MSIKISLGLDTTDINFIKKLIQESSNVDYFKLNPSFLLMDSNRIESIAFHLNANKKEWIFDAKYGDVYHTNKNLAKYAFEILNASAVTLNPYVGIKALLPFFYYTNKKCFILLKTTSPNKTQDLFWKEIVNQTKQYPNVHYIAPATNETFLLELLDYLPENKLILAPGIGAQGGIISIPSSRIIYSASRSILSCKDYASKQIDFYKNDSINKFYTNYLKEYILNGEFKLASGTTSDVYINLKNLYSHVEKINYLANVIKSILNIDQNTTFVGIESAGIPLASLLSTKSNSRFAYIRSSKKNYGTSSLLEGTVPLSSSIYLVDDVCTTGTSIFNAKKSLENLGYTNITPFVICLRNKNISNIKYLFSI